MFKYWVEYSKVDEYYFDDNDIDELAEHFSDYCEENNYEKNESNFIDFWNDNYSNCYPNMDFEDDNMEDFWNEVNGYLS
jgi:hypothetical protein